MAIKGKVTSWFLKNIVKPRREEIDQPGFINMRVGNSKVKRRQIHLPETLFCEIENVVTEEVDEGDKLLYETGQEFGWHFANTGDLPKKSDSSKREFSKFVNFFIKYLEVMWASEINHDLDIDAKNFEMRAKELNVCHKNGKGYLMAMGAVSGVVSYTFEDVEIDAGKPKCQGRGDEECRVVVSKDKVPEPSFSVEAKGQGELDPKYSDINEVSETEYAQYSLKDLLDTGQFDYEKGHLKYNDERYVRINVSLIYLLEKMLDADEILYDIAYESGKKVAEDKSDVSFVKEYLPALGWGDLQVMNEGEKVYLNHFPWTKFEDSVNFPIFRGFISGMISEVTGSEREYESYEANISEDGFTLRLESD